MQSRWVKCFQGRNFSTDMPRILHDIKIKQKKLTELENIVPSAAPIGPRIGRSRILTIILISIAINIDQLIQEVFPDALGMAP